MSNLAFAVIGALMLAIMAACAIELVRRSAFPKCPVCGSRRAALLDDDTQVYYCEVCGQPFHDK